MADLVVTIEDDQVTSVTLAEVDTTHRADTDNPHSVTAAQVGSPTTAAFNDHSARHENGGADEISVAGLSGELADAQPAKAHDLAGAGHNAATLAELNAKVSDATLDDSGDPRDPNAHTLGGAAHSVDTLANLNAKVSDATLADVDGANTWSAVQTFDQPPAGAVGRGATVTVAASDATADEIAQADHVCDGTADDVQIQAALDALASAGGVVRLSAGTFNITTKVTVSANQSLRGEGIRSTLLQRTADVVVIEVNGSGVSLGDFGIEQSGVGQPSDGIDIVDGNRMRMWSIRVNSIGGDGIRVKSGNLMSWDNIQVVSSGSDGIHMEAPAAVNINNSVFTNIDCLSNTANGVNIVDGKDNTFIGLVLQSNDTGLTVASSTDCNGNQFYNLHCESNTSSPGSIGASAVGVWVFESNDSGAITHNGSQKVHWTGNALIHDRPITAPYTQSGDIDADGNGGHKSVLQFRRDNLAASLTDDPIEGLDGRTDGYVMPRAGSVLGINVVSNADRSGGTATFVVEASTNGGASWSTFAPSTTLDGTDPRKNSTTQAKDTSVFNANDMLRVVVTTDGTWTPTTADVHVGVEVEF